MGEDALREMLHRGNSAQEVLYRGVAWGNVAQGVDVAWGGMLHRGNVASGGMLHQGDGTLWWMAHKVDDAEGCGTGRGLLHRERCCIRRCCTGWDVAWRGRYCTGRGVSVEGMAHWVLGTDCIQGG